MKNALHAAILPFTVALALLPVGASAQQVRVSGTVASEDSLQIIATRLMLSAAQEWAYEIFSVPADDFELVIETDAPVYLAIRGATTRLPPVLLEPGTDLRLDGSAEDGLQVTGQGVRGPAYLIREQPRQAWRAVFSEVYEGLQTTGADTDFAALMSRVDSVLTERNDEVEVAGLPPLYTRVLKAENLADALRAKEYALDHMEPEAAERATGAMLRQALAVPGGDTLAYAWRYTEALGNLLNDHLRHTVAALGGSASSSAYYHFRKATIQEPLLQKVMLAMLMDQLLRGEDYTDEMAALVDDFGRTAGSGPYRAYIEGRAVERRQLAPGQAAPDLAALTLEGDSITSDQLRGSVVLVTTWGSWCGWSKAQLPWLERVREALDGEEVVFLNFGWDEEESAWREAIAEYGLGGTHVLTDESLRTEWGLVKTPTFILLDREGNIVTVNPPRPSVDEGEALEAVIRQVLSGG